MAKQPKKPTNTSVLNDDDFLNSFTDELKDSGAIDWHENFCLFPSGFYPVDFSNTAFIEKETGDVYSGFATGRYMYIISPTGLGKSTLAMTIGGGICRPYPLSQLFVYDGEKSNRIERIQKLSGLPNNRIKLVNKNTNLENLYEFVNTLYEKKMDNYDRFKIKKTYLGKEVEVLQPSVVIIDSLASLTKKDISEGSTLGSNMENSQNAILGGKIIKNLLDKLISANIFLIVINHITTIVNTSIAPLPRNKIPGLKPEENVSGGSAWHYYADYFIKLSQEKIYRDEKDGKEGVDVLVTVIKARTGSTKTFEMYFDKDMGGVWDLNKSCAEMLLSSDVLVKAGSYLKFNPDLDLEFKSSFYLKDLEQLLNENEQFQNSFIKAMDAYSRKNFPILSRNNISILGENDLPELNDD